MLQEMLLHTVRWQPSSAEHEPIAQRVFSNRRPALHRANASENSTAFYAPHPSIVRAMEATLASSGQANLNWMLRHSGMSERSFRRHFHGETGMTGQDWIAQARLFHAANLLAESQRGRSLPLARCRMGSHSTLLAPF